MPPVRSGHIVASSARQKQRKQPAIVITPMRMMPSAPVPCTTAGAMPVTRIVPASPITKAPHQFVPLARPFSGNVPSTVAICSPLLPIQGGAAGAGQLCLEERQITLCLPVTHDGVPGVELLALDLRVVIDVVPIGRFAQGCPQHIVGN